VIIASDILSNFLQELVVNTRAAKIIANKKREDFIIAFSYDNKNFEGVAELFEYPNN
jgi:hypothetical protein